MPQYDLGILITVDSCLALFGLLVSMVFAWFLVRQNLRSQEITLDVARIAQRIDARLRRQYPDIDQDLQ